MKRRLMSSLLTFALLICVISAGVLTAAADDHTYGEPVFSWTEDLSACTVSYGCSHCEEVWTADCTVTAVSTDATCTEAGSVTYTATVDIAGVIYTDEQTNSIPAKGHIYADGICTGCGVSGVPEVTTFNVISSGKPRLTWNAVAGAVKYRVYRAESIDGEYSAMLNTANTSYTNATVTPGTTYYYFVRAIAADGSICGDSNVVTVVAKCARPVITASNVASSGKPRITWEAVEGAVKYRVYRSETKDGEYSAMLTTDGTSYTNSSAEAGKVYYYKVVALAETSAANSAESAVKQRTCDLANPVITASNVAATGKPQLSWTAVPGAVQYKIYRAESKDGSYSLMKSTTLTTYTNTKADAGVTYYYKVVAVAENTDANSAGAIKQRTCDCAQPVIKAIAGYSGKPYLSWKAIPGATGYQVYRATSKSGPYTLMMTVKDGTEYTNTKAEIGTTYYYKIKAICDNDSASSVFSNVDSQKAIKNEYKYTYSKFTINNYRSGYSRNINLSLACKSINGTILAPGEEFSYLDVVGPWGPKKGYQLATVITKDGYSTGYGGGVCQVASTLFNAVLKGNLQITRRRQHSMAISYLAKGRDAMVNWKSSDFRFVNNTDYYIKIKASSSGGTTRMTLLTRESGVSPSDDVKLKVTYSKGTYTLRRYYKGEVNYTTTSNYK